MSLARQSPEARLGEIEARLDAIQSRLDLIEGRGQAAPEIVLESANPPAPDDAGTEYWIGAKLLPRVGAVLIVLATAVVAALEASKSGSFNNSAILIVEAVFCLGFVAVGEWKRDELEGFGQTLAAIGSCGLYLTAAGGHFAYHQLSPAGMAAGFAGLTVLNHAYAALRRSRLFFMIGAAGGLAAMLFPLSQQDYDTALVVYATVTVAGAAACALRRWLWLAFLGWFFGLLYLAPIIDSQQSRVAIVAAMYLASLACIGAYAHACSSTELDPPAIGAGIAAFATAVLGFWVLPGTYGTAHLLTFAAVGICAALPMPRNNLARAPLLVGSAAAALLLAPLGLGPLLGVYAFASLAIAAMGIGRLAIPKFCGVSSVVLLLMAAVDYIRVAGSQGPERQYGLLVALAVGVVAASSAIRHAGLPWIGFAVCASWGLIARAAYLLSPVGVSGEAPYSALTLALIGYSVALLLLGFRMRSARLRIWSFVAMLATSGEILLAEGSTSAAFRLVALVVMGGLMLFGGYHYVHERHIAESAVKT